jgi:PTH1 family peptidyl-tRNA hydrolase
VKLIVGLGNPGAEYDGTRHNVGFDVVDAVASRWRVDFQSAPVDALVARTYPVGEGEIVLLAKPLTFMNLSGHAVGALLRYYRIATPDLLVVTEDVNLPLGRLRARRQGSSGGHNGLASVIEVVGTHRFSRFRVGVGRGDPHRRLSGRVLSRFDANERPVIDDAIGRVVDAVGLFVEEGIEPVMNRFNRREEEEGPEDETAPS